MQIPKLHIKGGREEEMTEGRRDGKKGRYASLHSSHIISTPAPLCCSLREREGREGEERDSKTV
jgi:hypothetical protein